MINTDGATGSSVDAEIHELVSQILADVQTVSYTATFVYVETSGVPSYMTGPFPDGNPAYPSDLDATYWIPRSPQVDSSGNDAEVGLGPQGFLSTGSHSLTTPVGRRTTTRGFGIKTQTSLKPMVLMRHQNTRHLLVLGLPVVGLPAAVVPSWQGVTTTIKILSNCVKRLATTG